MSLETDEEYRKWLEKYNYQYVATWCDSIEEADKEYEGVFTHTGWMNWNGVSLIPPKFVRYKGKTYTYEDFKKEVWGIK